MLICLFPQLLEFGFLRAQLIFERLNAARSFSFVGPDAARRGRKI
jgi:hypothetical protein